MLLLGIILCLLWRDCVGAPPVTGTSNTAVSAHISQSNETLLRLSWEDAVAKGSQLWAYLQDGCYPDKFDPPSIWELKKNNWIVDPWPLARTRYEDIHPQLPPEPMEMIGILRGPFYFEEAVSYDASEGAGTKFLATFSPKSGLIVAQNSRRDSRIQVFWSDAMFAMWQAVNARYSTPASALRYVLRSQVTNVDTTHIIRQIQEQVSESSFPLDIYPSGISFNWFLALLGTPNGAGSLYLLLDHKRSLGFKTVRKITLFSSGPGSTCHMLIELENFQPKQASSSQNVMLSNQSRSNNDTSGDSLFDGCSPKSLISHAPEVPQYETS